MPTFDSHSKHNIIYDTLKARLDQRDYANAPVILSAFQRDNF